MGNFFTTIQLLALFSTKITTQDHGQLRTIEGEAQGHFEIPVF
jgi:hypothetical protein